MAKGGNTGRPIGSGGKETGGLHRLGACVVALFVTMGITLLPQMAAETKYSPSAATGAAALQHASGTLASAGRETLRWFEPTPRNKFSLPAQEPIELSVLDAVANVTNGDASSQSVVFYIEFRNHWMKLCTVTAHDALKTVPRTGPGPGMNPISHGVLYICDAFIPHHLGNVSLSFDVYEHGSLYRRHPDGIRYGFVKGSVTPPASPDLYGPHDFQMAYDVHGNAHDQTIGVILGGMPLRSQDLTMFAHLTHTPPLIPGTSGPDTVEWRFIGDIKDHAGANGDTRGELAMDVEYAHAMAPGSHLVVWLVPIHNQAKAKGIPDPSFYHYAVSAAVNEVKHVKVVTNSWYLPSWFTYQYTFPGNPGKANDYAGTYDTIAGLLHTAAGQ